MSPIAHIFDPTIQDQQSKVRGIGRYVQTLQEADLNCTFVNDIKNIPKNGIFINPFFNIYQKPLKIGRIASKQIAIIHDLIPLKYERAFPVGLKGHWYKFLNKWSLKNYDLIVTDSIVSKQDIIKYLKIPEKRISIIYPTVPKLFLPHLDTHEESIEHHHPFHKEQDTSVAEFSTIPLEKLTQSTILTSKKDYVIYVGDATWNKNLPLLAQAIMMANVPCVCVGKVFSQAGSTTVSTQKHPWQRSLNAFLQMVKGNPLFIFPGYVSDLDLKLLYKKARANILLSIDEGFGYSFIESGYTGTPSILSDTPIFHETAKNAASFADIHKPHDVAQKISELFYDNMKREKMSIEAFDRAQEYTPEKFKQRWTEVIQSLYT